MQMALVLRHSLVGTESQLAILNREFPRCGAFESRFAPRIMLRRGMDFSKFRRLYEFVQGHLGMAVIIAGAYTGARNRPDLKSFRRMARRTDVPVALEVRELVGRRRDFAYYLLIMPNGSTKRLYR